MSNPVIPEVHLVGGVDDVSPIPVPGLLRLERNSHGAWWMVVDLSAVRFVLKDGTPRQVVGPEGETRVRLKGQIGRRRGQGRKTRVPHPGAMTSTV